MKQPGEQLKMFMTPREIISGWAPAEGDRLMYRDKPETNEQLWSRKLIESDDPSRPFMRGGQGVITGQSLYEHMRTPEGFANLPPVHLGYSSAEHVTGDPRPMVAGGQHRIAAMAHINPDQYMAVLHHNSILDAKDDPRYT